MVMNTTQQKIVSSALLLTAQIKRIALSVMHALLLCAVLISATAHAANITVTTSRNPVALAVADFRLLRVYGLSAKCHGSPVRNLVLAGNCGLQRTRRARPQREPTAARRAAPRARRPCGCDCGRPR